MAQKEGVEKEILDLTGSQSFAQRQNSFFSEGFSFSGFERDGLYLGHAGGPRFRNISGVSGLDSISDGRGIPWVDLDNDGDLDLVMTTIQGRTNLLFRNEVGQDRGWLRLALEGRASGRDAFGTIVRVHTSQGLEQKIKSGGSGFLSQPDPRLLFGLGDDATTGPIEIRWPSGRRQAVDPLPARSSWRIVEGEAPLRVEERAARLPDPAQGDADLLAKLGVRPGEPLPGGTLRGLGGTPTTLAAVLPAGRPAVVNLWATWCRTCAQEMPELDRLAAGAGEGLAVIGISVDMEKDVPKIPPLLRERSIDYPVYVAGEDLVQRFFHAAGTVFVPVSFLVDAEGRLVEAFSGWNPAHRARLEGFAAAAAGTR